MCSKCRGSPDGPPQPSGLLDLRATKERIAIILPPGHPVRELLLQEPDFVPGDEAVVKFEMFARLLLLTEASGVPDGYP